MVCDLSVCLLDTLVSPAKTAELIKVPFGVETRIGPWNHVLEGIRILPREGAIFYRWSMWPSSTITVEAGLCTYHYRGTLVVTCTFLQQLSIAQLL